MRHCTVAVVLLGLLGCNSPGDPQATRLAPGSEAIVVQLDELTEKSKLDDATAVDARGEPTGLKLGTKVIIVDDAGHHTDLTKERFRFVRVNALNGEHAGEVLKIRRAFLRAVPGPPR